MADFIKPRAFSTSPKAAVLAPASPARNADELEAVLAAVRDLGFRPLPMPSLRAQADYLAGSDEVRAADLRAAFADPEIEAIFCLRGGYGSARLLPLVDWREARRHRPLFVGFSDLTSVHAALYSHAHLATLHAPTLGVFVREGARDEASFELLRQALHRREPLGSLRESLGDSFRPQTIAPGRAHGRLIGGNLSVFVTLVGTKWLPDPNGAILFLEDINEKPYRLDRCLTHLRNCGFLDRLAGVCLGQFTDCTAGAPDRDSAETVLERCLHALKLPVISGIPSGHGRPSLPLPMGVRVELDATAGDLITCEATTE